MVLLLKDGVPLLLFSSSSFIIDIISCPLSFPCTFGSNLLQNFRGGGGGARVFWSLKVGIFNHYRTHPSYC